MTFREKLSVPSKAVLLLKTGPIVRPETSVTNYNLRCVTSQKSEDTNTELSNLNYAMGWMTGESRIDSRLGQWTHLFSQVARLTLGPTGAQRAKRPQSEGPSIAEVKNVFSYASTPPTRSTDWRLIITGKTLLSTKYG